MIELSYEELFQGNLTLNIDVLTPPFQGIPCLVMAVPEDYSIQHTSNCVSYLMAARNMSMLHALV
jgi:hypothetical protein